MKRNVYTGILAGCFVATLLWCLERLTSLEWVAIEDPKESLNSFYFELQHFILNGYFVFPSLIGGFVAKTRGFLVGLIVGVLGVILFFLLSNYFPFPGGATKQVVLKDLVLLFKPIYSPWNTLLDTLLIPAICGAAGQLLATNKQPNRTASPPIG